MSDKVKNDEKELDNIENELYKEQFHEWLTANRLVIQCCQKDIKSCMDNKNISDEMIVCNENQIDIQKRRTNKAIEDYNEWADRENEIKLEMWQ